MTMSGQLHRLVTLPQGKNGELGTLNKKDLLPLLGSEPWTVQPVAWTLFGNPALQ